MDPLTCRMCEGAIPGDEIHTRKTCPSCGADLSALVRRRLASLRPAAAPPQPTSFATRAAWLSLLAPCFGMAVNLFGRRALSGSPLGMLVLETICALFIVGGFILGVVAFFARKSEAKGTRAKAIAGICINGLIISFAILGILTRQKPAASENNTPDHTRKGWSYLSGK